MAADMATWHEQAGMHTTPPSAPKSNLEQQNCDPRAASHGRRHGNMARAGGHADDDAKSPQRKTGEANCYPRAARHGRRHGDMARAGGHADDDAKSPNSKLEKQNCDPRAARHGRRHGARPRAAGHAQGGARGLQMETAWVFFPSAEVFFPIAWGGGVFPKRCFSQADGVFPSAQ